MFLTTVLANEEGVAVWVFLDERAYPAVVVGLTAPKVVSFIFTLGQGAAKFVANDDAR